jgi:hypothetical protein
MYNIYIYIYIVYMYLFDVTMYVEFNTYLSCNYTILMINSGK